MRALWLTWTSGVDFGRQFDYFWESTGEFIGPHVNWAADEPNNANGVDHCLELMNVGGGIYKWNDASCINKNTYICKS